MAKSLNRVQLIGNLTRDPELRYTPSGTAVCSFGLATNRSWTTDTGEKKEDTEFHNIVGWNKLAELCSQYLTKGRKAYVEGRLVTRSYTGQLGQQKSRTEVVIEDMIILDSKGPGHIAEAGKGRPAALTPKETAAAEEQKAPKTDAEPEQLGTEDVSDVNPDEIPF
jgi:single-strand DNA-binding protein